MNQIEQLIETRPRRTGCLYKVSPFDTSLAIDLPGQPYVDRQAMAATAVISTATIDRVGDVLIPAGCRLENYAKNPVVLWAHGLEGIGQPIATSRDPQGNLAIRVSAESVEATSWFSQSLLEAAQIFELIDEGIVRATSVRETPIKSQIRRDPEMGDVVVVDEWELEEWSWCAVGVNPDAVAKALRRNRLGGRAIVPSILKSLRAVAPTPRRFGIGIPREKIVTELKPFDQNRTDMLPDSELDSDIDVGAANQPYGSTIIAAVHASLACACENIEDAMGPLENPTVKNGLQAILAPLYDQLTALEGLYSSNYPELPSLKNDDDADEQDDSAMKAFLASSQVASLQLLGMSTRLKGLIASRNLTAIQRQTLKGVAHQFASLVAKSKSSRREDHETRIAALQKSIGELVGLVEMMKRRALSTTGEF